MRALEIITGHVIYNPACTYNFQLKTTPDTENSGTLSNAQNRWWERQWKQAFYESQVINDLIDEKFNVNSKKEFYDHVLDLIKADTEKLLTS